MIIWLLCLGTTVGAKDALPDFKALRSQYLQPPAQWPAPTLDKNIPHRELGLLPSPPVPADNPLTKAKVLLGKQLFFDPQLSGSQQIACASCHDSDLGWADGRRVSFGHNRQAGKRNAPSIENSAYSKQLFWDGRADSLETQALLPIVNPIEMNFTLVQLVQRLQQLPHYQKLFKQAFPHSSISAITSENIAKAIASYERTIISRESSFDRFLLAPQQTNPRFKQIFNQQFSDNSLWGLHLFRTKARCLNCHNGPLLSDNQLHDIGLSFYQRELEDLGRFEVTKVPSDVGKFKTPTLRGIMNNKPWMHNGLFTDMQGVISLYNRGGPRNTYADDDPLAPQQSELLKPLSLTTAEADALIAFLTAITAQPSNDSHPKIMETLPLN